MIIGVDGGWGYNNLGDEAILAGYLHALSPYGDIVVGSPDPARTSAAQSLPQVRFAQEGAIGRTDALVLGGGGYLNGSWLPEIARKTHRLARDNAMAGRTVVSSVEVRSLSSNRIGRRIASAIGSASVSVRDNESAAELAQLGVRADVLPDGISLLTPHLDGYIHPLPSLEGKTLVNFLDIARRPDAAECELGASGFKRFATETIERLGNNAVGLIIGDGDYSFMRNFPRLTLITPTTVSHLISAIASCSALISVRMHPALLASALKTPVAAVPYCGKVRPTLSKIGVSSIILESFTQVDLEARLALTPDFDGQWAAAHTAVATWLSSNLRAAGAS